MYNSNEQEQEILKYWEKHQCFEKSVSQRPENKPYVFYDGPPFATGLPHYGHIVASLMKDVVPRYWTMQGYRVERKWGWDCHGLPIENIIEKKLDLKSKQDILDMGVDKFNEACSNTVLTYAQEWKKTIKRMGRWVDMEDDYKTMDKSFMESVWWVFKQLWDKDLIYEGYKAMHICPRCVTPLSNFEVTQGYKDIKDLSVTAKFKLANTKEKLGIEGDLSILAWTTTPWTLPGNVLLAVGVDIDYVIAEVEEQGLVIIAKERVEDVLADKKYSIQKELKGKDLVGLEYEPLFPYFSDTENAFKVVAGDFVSTDEGTGVVHIAPAFGDDDYRTGQENKTGWVQHVTMEGKFVDEVTDFVGQEVKPKDDHTRTDVEIIKYLAHNGKLFSKLKYEHSYPHCWRCDTPLLNYATSSWFVKVTDLKDKLLQNNKKITWVPQHIKEGRFGKWLEGAHDWAISRSRYWGTPLPVWKSEDGDVLCVGSVDELRKYAEEKINKIIFIRHGGSTKNKDGIKSSSKDKHPLTDEGIDQVNDFVDNFDEQCDIIISSPILRCRQTAEIIQKKVGGEIVYDDLISEINEGSWEELNGDKLNELTDYKQYKKLEYDKERFEYKTGGQESRLDVMKRVKEFLKNLEKNYSGKTVILVGHGVINAVLQKIFNDIDFERYFWEEEVEHVKPKIFYIREDGQSIDLHKHTVDKMVLNKNGKEYKRISEVLDCWFESGSMPYGQMNYPYSNKTKFEDGFPAEFIAEGQDQTRGWFYTLHVLATALTSGQEKSIPKGKRWEEDNDEGIPAFKNVIVNGIVLAEDGKKMSKRLSNYPDPNEVLEKYGADAMRYYLVSSPVMHAESLNFSEQGVREMYNKVINTVHNVLEFYLMYNTDLDGLKKDYTDYTSENVLDRWIMAKLQLLVKEVTARMGEYKLAEASRPILEFITEISQWYVRRSRDRFKIGDEVDKQNAVATLNEVLMTLSKIMAPFTPFIAEKMYLDLGGEKESVHLEEWPEVKEDLLDNEVIKNMEMARKIVEMGLSLRVEHGIKVKQPLSKLIINNEQLTSDLRQVIAEELNVKSVENNKNVGDEENLVWKEEGELKLGLDLEITPELKKEGLAREIIRAVNNIRKEKNLNIDNKAVVQYETDDELLKQVFVEYKDELMKNTASSDIVEGMGETEVVIGGVNMKLKVIE